MEKSSFKGNGQFCLLGHILLTVLYSEKEKLICQLFAVIFVQSISRRQIWHLWLCHT